MASIVVRDLDDNVKRALVDQANRHGRSMEAEAREILAAGVEKRPDNIGLALLNLFATDPCEELELPPRSETPRAAAFDE